MFCTFGFCATGLGGEIREVGRIEQRLIEAAKLGFNTFVIAAAHTTPTTNRLANVQIIRCKHITDALKAVLGTGQSRRTLGVPDRDDSFDLETDMDVHFAEPSS